MVSPDGKTVVFTSEHEGEQRGIVITPLDYRAQQRLRYAEWVRQRRQLTSPTSVAVWSSAPSRLAP